MTRLSKLMVLFLVLSVGFIAAPLRGRYNPITWLRTIRDVNITEPESDNDILQYDLATDRWVNIGQTATGWLVDFEDDETSGKLTALGGFNINSVVDMTANNSGSSTDLLIHQGTASTSQFVTEFKSADSDGTDRVQLVITGLGGFTTGGPPGDYHALQIRWSSEANAYELFTIFNDGGGGVTFKPFHIGNHSDGDMFKVSFN